MAAPGSFTSGSVLTAAEMNALPGGLLDSDQPAANVSISSTPATVGSVTFTLAATRTVMLGFSVPIVRNWAGVTYVDCLLQDATASPYLALRLGTADQGGSVQRISSLAAGSYTFTLTIASNAGTAQLFGGATHIAPLIYALDVKP